MKPTPMGSSVGLGMLVRTRIVSSMLASSAAVENT